MTIDTSRLEPIAFATSRRTPDNPQRWTELRLFYRPGERRPFVSEVVGMSTYVDEAPRVRQRVERTLSRALETFLSSDLSTLVMKQARAWEARQPSPPVAAPSQVQFNGAGGLLGALAWLYEGSAVDCEKESRLVAAFAHDFGVPERTVRHALAGQREGKELPSWCAAFIGALMHFDREAFGAMRRPA